MRTYTVASLLLALTMVLPLRVFADAENNGDTAEPPATQGEMRPLLNDSRLPPVMPGEEIRRDGKSMKMWSTSGAVHADEDAAMRVRQAPAIVPPVSVILDNRASGSASSVSH